MKRRDFLKRGALAGLIGLGVALVGKLGRAGEVSPGSGATGLAPSGETERHLTPVPPAPSGNRYVELDDLGRGGQFDPAALEQLRRMQTHTIPVQYPPYWVYLHPQPIVYPTTWKTTTTFTNDWPTLYATASRGRIYRET